MGAKQGAPLGLGLQSRGSGGGEPSGVHEGPVQKPRASGMVVGDAGEEGACGSHAQLSSAPALSVRVRPQTVGGPSGAG